MTRKLATTIITTGLSALAVIVWAVTQATVETHYAAPGGSATGQCPISQPCTIARAATLTGPGDTIVLTGTFTAAKVSLTLNGTEAQPITVQGPATLDSTGVSMGDTDATLKCNSCSWVVFKSFVIQNSGARGLSFSGAHHLTVDGITVRHVGQRAIGGSGDDVTIRNVLVEYAAEDNTTNGSGGGWAGGISSYTHGDGSPSHRWTLSDSTIRFVRGECAIALRIESWLAERNTFANCYNIYTDKAQQVVWANNTITQLQGWGKYGGIGDGFKMANENPQLSPLLQLSDITFTDNTVQAKDCFSYWHVEGNYSKLTITGNKCTASGYFADFDSINSTHPQPADNIWQGNTCTGSCATYFGDTTDRTGWTFDLVTATPTRTASATRTATKTRTVTHTATPTSSPSATVTLTKTASPSATASPTLTTVPTITSTPSATETSTDTPAPDTETPTREATATATPTESSTPTATVTQTRTATWTATSSRTPSRTPSATNTSTNTATPSYTPSPTLSPTLEPSSTPTFTKTPTRTPTSTVTPVPPLNHYGIMATFNLQGQAAARNLGVRIGRVTIFADQWFASGCVQCEQAISAGLKLNITLRANGGTNNPTTYPFDFAAYGSAVDAILDRYAANIEFINVENEADNDLFYIGTPLQYAEVLRVVCDKAHARGVKCATDGTTWKKAALLAWAAYNDAGANTAACSFAWRAFGEAEAPDLCNHVVSDFANQQKLKGRAFLDAYATADIDLLMLHVYSSDYYATAETINQFRFAYCQRVTPEKCQRVKVAINESGDRLGKSENVIGLLQAAHDVGVAYLIYWNFDRSGGNFALTNADGMLRPTGATWGKWLQENQ